MRRASVITICSSIAALAVLSACAQSGPEPEGGTAPDEVFDEEGTCPPVEPFGTELGATIPDLELPDCDGNLHRVHDLCDREAAWIFSFAPW